MAIIDEIYGAVDDHGLITSPGARGLGISDAELVQQARRGKLLRVGRGVYRVPAWPHQESAPYAEAVKRVGEGAYPYGESVVALLGLAPTDPSTIWVASPRRVRRSLGRAGGYVRLRTLMANAVVAQLLPDGVIKGERADRRDRRRRRRDGVAVRRQAVRGSST